MIQVNLQCPHCRENLMDAEYKIDNQDSVRVEVELGGKRGWLRLSSLYGSYTIESEFDLPLGTIATFFCPHCDTELRSKRFCEECGAPMVAMNFKEGGIVQICSRRGCKKHLIEFEDLESELRAFYNRYSPF